MALASYAWGYDGGTYNGKDMRQLVEAMFPTPASGVVTGLTVTQESSPTSTVSVAAGKAIVDATGSGLTGAYHAWNDAALSSPTIDPTTTNGRKDRLILRVSSGVPALEVVKGTAAASPAEPSITGDNYLELALITLPSSTSNITNAMITDRRVWASALRAPVIATSSTRPASPVEGEQIVETDTDRTLIYSGSAWVRSGWYSTSGRTGGEWARSTSLSISNATATAITFPTENADSDGFLTPTSGTFTVPTALDGLYVFDYSVVWGANNGSMFRNWLSVNSTTLPTAASATIGGMQYDITNAFANPGWISGSATFRLVAGDVVRLMAYQTTGGAYSVTSAAFSGWRIGA